MLFNSFVDKKKISVTVREMLEKMGKTLFFRSGNHPLILSEEQREERKACKLERERWTHCTCGDLFINIHYLTLCPYKYI